MRQRCERFPLAGAGRAGKFGELLASSGGKYEGEILAGRPHGHGRYMVQTVRAPHARM